MTGLWVAAAAVAPASQQLADRVGRQGRLGQNPTAGLAAISSASSRSAWVEIRITGAAGPA